MKISFLHKKRVFIVHGWTAIRKKDGFLVKEKLEEKEFKVLFRSCPRANEQRIQSKGSASAFSVAVGIADGQTYFVGHSMGCVSNRTCESLPDGAKIGGVIFVGAGFFKRLTNLERRRHCPRCCPRVADHAS